MTAQPSVAGGEGVADSAEAPAAGPPNVRFHDFHPTAGDSVRELLAGLARDQKVVDPKFFYDQHGSQLFDRITRLPEYYPTRTEISLLKQYGAEISDCCGPGCVLIEPGAGSCEKVRLLLDELRPAAYVPLDISADFLRPVVAELGRDYPWLQIHAVCADFKRDWTFARQLPEGRRVVFYPGSTIGNLEPEDARAMLARMAELVGAGGGVLLGVDLHKSTQRLQAAYNDASGLTAEFNLNVLARINALLESEFDPDSFRHLAFYDEERQRIEMHLVSRTDQAVPCNGTPFRFSEGETIHTENSYKYTLEGLAGLAESAGLIPERQWVDDERLFSVHFFRVD